MDQLIFRVISEFPVNMEIISHAWIITSIDNEGNPPLIHMELAEDPHIKAEVDFPNRTIRIIQTTE